MTIIMMTSAATASVPWTATATTSMVNHATFWFEITTVSQQHSSQFSYWNITHLRIVSILY